MRSGCSLEWFLEATSSTSWHCRRLERSVRVPKLRVTEHPLCPHGAPTSYVQAALNHAAQRNLRRFCHSYTEDAPIPWVPRSRLRSWLIQVRFPIPRTVACLACNL